MQKLKRIHQNLRLKIHHETPVMFDIFYKKLFTIFNFHKKYL